MFFLTRSSTGAVLGHCSDFLEQEIAGVGAIYAKKFWLAEDAVRDIVAGALPYTLFQGARLQDDFVTTRPHQRYSFLWGDFMLYINGDPAMRDLILVRGIYGAVPVELLGAATAAFLCPKTE